MPLTLITPTADQPTGFALCEYYMRRQTYPLASCQWIVVDDGITPVRPTLGQYYIRREREPDCTGAQSFCRNLLAAISHVQGSKVAVTEHDDYYAPTHLETLLTQLDAPGVVAAGDDEQRYYNVAHRCWRIFDNTGASLCQTGFDASQLPAFTAQLQLHLQQNKYGVDYAFWRGIPPARRSLRRTHTCVGIKGLPGRPGLGIGHRPAGGGWRHDPELETLTTWIGAPAAARYLPYQLTAPSV